MQALVQQLGFDWGEPMGAPMSTPISAPMSAPPQTPPQPSSQPQQPSDTQLSKSVSGPMAKGEDFVQVVGLASWQHPLANRQLRLPTAVLGYHLKRGKRTTVGMSVGIEGVTVNAPRWSTVGDIEAVLLSKADWLIAKLQEMQARGKELASAHIQWADGVVLPVLGCSVCVSLDPSHQFVKSGHALHTLAGHDVQWHDSGAWSANGEVLSDGTPLRLFVALPQAATANQIRDITQAWLMRLATLVFAQRLDRYAHTLNVRYTQLKLSSASTRWGSATSQGHIRLNWRLVHGPLSVVDYVVVHELSHLREMNHGPQFWGTVASVMPEFEHHRDHLKSLQLPVW
jgi:predicted metal-dependent hydrolase